MIPHLIERHRVLLVVLSLIGVLYITVAGPSITPLTPFTFGSIDDSMFVTYATSLARGEGYRELAFAGEPPVTHSNPGFPGVLSLAIKLVGSFPANRFVLTLVSVVSGLLLLTATYGFFTNKQGLALNGNQALWLVILTGLSPLIVWYSARLVMSEMLYTMLAMFCLWRLDVLPMKQGKASWAGLALAGLLVSVAFYVRFVGISLLLAAVALLLWHRRWRYAVGIIAIFAVAVLPWLYRNALVGTTALGGDHLTILQWRSFGERQDGMVSGPGEILARVIHNSVAHGLHNAPTVLFPWLEPSGKIDIWLANVGHISFARDIMALIILGILIVGVVRDMRTGLSISVVYGLFYGAMILLPPWVTRRNLVPVIPLFLFYLLVGVQGIVGWCLPRVNKTTMFSAVSAFVLIGFLVSDRRFVLSEQRYLTNPDLSSQTAVRVLDWIRCCTSQDSRFLSPNPYALYLYTDRRSVGLSSVLSTTELENEIRTRGVDYVVYNPDLRRVAGDFFLMGETTDVEQLVQNKTMFQVVFQTTDAPRIRIYEVR